MTFILIVWLAGSLSNAPPIVVTTFDTLLGCDKAGRVWERTQSDHSSSSYIHYACLPK